MFSAFGSDGWKKGTWILIMECPSRLVWIVSSTANWILQQILGDFPFAYVVQQYPPPLPNSYCTVFPTVYPAIQLLLLQLINAILVKVGECRKTFQSLARMCRKPNVLATTLSIRQSSSSKPLVAQNLSER